MALQPCRECRGRISTEATVCPRCGCPNPTTSIPQENTAYIEEKGNSRILQEDPNSHPQVMSEESQMERISTLSAPKYVLLRWLTLLPLLGFTVWLINWIFIFAYTSITALSAGNSSSILLIFRSIAAAADRATIPILSYYWSPMGKFKAASTLTAFAAVLWVIIFFGGRNPAPVTVAGLIGLAAGWLIIRYLNVKSGAW